MDVKEVKEMKCKLEVDLLSAVMDFEAEVELPIAAIKIQRVDTSTLERKSSLIGSLEVILTL